MRVSLSAKPFNRHSFSTLWLDGTAGRVGSLEQASAAVLLGLAGAATLTTWVRSPLPAWGYALGVFLLAGVWTARDTLTARALRITLPGAALAVISLWGFVQLGLVQLGMAATVYRYATLDAAVRTAALGATAFAASRALRSERLRLQFLTAFAWFGFAVSLVAVLAFFTSPGRVLWVFPSPYPDTWGPFLSRNDFAGFLGLSFPVACWLGLRERPSGVSPWIPAAISAWIPAWMLAAGVASASRAGAILLVGEAIAIFAITPRPRAMGKFVIAAAVFIAITGAGTLLGRLGDPDPLSYRREIARSTVEMIAAHPWRGFGVGTFAQVYPAYASFDAGAAVEHAHNDWLEWAAGGGVLYAAAWAVLALALSAPAVRSVWGLGIMAAFLHALVDYPFARFGLTAWTFALIGALDADSLRELRGRVH
jgi:O-antigen ligase